MSPSCPSTIRRFIDPEATLLWLDKNQECPARAIGYAFDGATFCNSKDKITFEEILASFKLDQNAALARIGTLIHALDVGDTQVARKPRGCRRCCRVRSAAVKARTNCLPRPK